MTMRFGQWMIVLILTGTYALASAEFYRYTDEKGKVHFTDDLGNVPFEQRPKADEYEEPYDELTQEERVEEKEEETETSEGILEETGEARPQEEAQLEEVEEKTLEQKLKETGAKLQEEYEALAKERGELDKMATPPLTQTSRKELIKKVKDYNLRSKDYEMRRKAFNKEVEAYNAGIKEEVREAR
ncbi:MAG TPA: DUF4124 domain-containing protein [Desulfobacterales bacterium]|nr:DUF4124 domain-containing protein [Desulfobacterales bacterium]